MSETAVVVHADAEVLAQAVAARLIVRLVDAQASRGYASVVLTGGRVADATYRAVRDSPARDAINWANVDLWWGDERFLPAGQDQENPPARPRTEPYKTHLAYVKERRSEADGAAILDEAMKRLHEARGR